METDGEILLELIFTDLMKYVYKFLEYLVTKKQIDKMKIIAFYLLWFAIAILIKFNVKYLVYEDVYQNVKKNSKMKQILSSILIMATYLKSSNINLVALADNNLIEIYSK